MTEEMRKKLMRTCNKVLMVDGASVKDPEFYQEIKNVLYEFATLEDEVNRLKKRFNEQETWHKVKEDVPNECDDVDVDVWVCCVDSHGNKNVHRSVFFGRDFFDEGGWPIKNATHWKYREAPNPPKESEQ